MSQTNINYVLGLYQDWPSTCPWKDLHVTLCCPLYTPSTTLRVHWRLSGKKKFPANAGTAGDSGLIPGLGRSPGDGHSNPCQYSCLGNLTDKVAWRVIVHGAAKSWTWLKQSSTHCTLGAASHKNFGDYYRLKVCVPQIPMLNANAQCDGLWSWSLWKVIRSWGQTLNEWN